MRITQLIVILAAVTLATCHKSHNPLVELKDLLEGDRPISSSSITIVASPRILDKRGDTATVKLSGVNNPLKTDIIAVYSPAHVDITKTTPIKYLPGTLFGEDYVKTGAASVQFEIVNMHTDVAFYFYKNASHNRWTSNKLQYAARSNTIVFSSMSHPNQGHLALTGKEGEMKLMWASGHKRSAQKFMYGKESGKYTNIVNADTYTYAASDLCGEPATTWGWKNPGWLHEAVAKKLEKGVKYFYVYGSNATGWSDENTFVGPTPAGADETLQFVAIGDLGKYQTDRSTEHWGEDNAPYLTTRGIYNTVKSGKAELVLHVGDIAYAVGYSAQWDEFLDQIKPVSERVPWMTLPGNHERDWINGASLNVSDSLGECGVPYEQRFRMPTPGVDQLWYSFETGPVHFITMSTEHHFEAGSAQYEWIAKDLASIDRKKTPWVVVSGHRPMYLDSSNFNPLDGDQTVASALRDALEHLLVQYKVDVCFWGHHHSYQRTCPVVNEQCVADGEGPIHFDVGNAGFGMSTNIQKDRPKYSLFVDIKEHGFSTVTVDKNNFVLEYHGNQSGVKDRLHLKK